VRSESDNGISLSALLIASISSAAAALVVHALWAPGTLASAALTPVLVQLFAEALRHPTRRIATLASQRTSRPPSRWLQATALGLLSFAIAAVTLTAFERVLSHSLFNANERGTLLGGRRAQPHVSAPRPVIVTVTVPAPAPPITRPGARTDRTQTDGTQATTTQPATTTAPVTTPLTSTSPTTTTTTPSDSPPTATSPSSPPGTP
jgi:hypothetical protein